MVASTTRAKLCGAGRSCVANLDGHSGYTDGIHGGC